MQDLSLFAESATKRVAIGTSSPQHLLHLYKTDGNNAELDIQSVAGMNNHWAIYNNRGDNQLRFWKGENILTITPDGKVGIGTTDPQNKLTINSGNIKVGSTLIKGDGTVSNNLNSDKLDDYDATDILSAASAGSNNLSSGYDDCYVTCQGKNNITCDDDFEPVLTYGKGNGCTSTPFPPHVINVGGDASVKCYIYRDTDNSGNYFEKCELNDYATQIICRGNDGVNHISSCALCCKKYKKYPNTDPDKIDKDKDGILDYDSITYLYKYYPGPDGNLIGLDLDNSKYDTSANLSGTIIYVTTDGHKGNFQNDDNLDSVTGGYDCSGKTGAELARCHLDNFCIQKKPTELKCNNIHSFISITSDDSIKNMPNNYGYYPYRPVYWYNSDNKILTKLDENWAKMLDGNILTSQGNGTGRNVICWTGSDSGGGLLNNNNCVQWSDKTYSHSRGDRP